MHLCNIAWIIYLTLYLKDIILQKGHSEVWFGINRPDLSSMRDRIIKIVTMKFELTDIIAYV